MTRRQINKQDNIITLTQNSRTRKPNPKAFKPGVSGNPGGRPKAVQEINELARSYAPEALERLAFWMRTDDPKASPAASQALLNRGLGMPMQATELSGPGGAALQAPSLNVAFVAAAPQAPKPEPTTIEPEAEPALVTEDAD